MGKTKTGVILKCLNCGKEVYVQNCRIKTFKFCSKSCGALHARNRTVSKCEICNKEFEHISSRAKTVKYCSRECYNKSLIGKGTKEFICEHCGKIFYDSPSRNRKYCSVECNNKTSKQNFNPKFSTVRKQMLRRNMITKCQICGYDENTGILGVHHKDHNRNNNSIENLMVLCPTCHSLQHNKHVCH